MSINYTRWSFCNIYKLNGYVVHLKLICHMSVVSHSFCRSGIQERLSWVILGQDSSGFHCGSGSAATRSGQGLEDTFPGSLTWLLPGAAVPHHMGLSTGMLATWLSPKRGSKRGGKRNMPRTAGSHLRSNAHHLCRHYAIGHTDQLWELEKTVCRHE